MKRTILVTLVALVAALVAPAFTIAAQPGSLIKLSCPSEADATHPCRSVYYLGEDGKRYVFPNQKTYNTWYSDFSSVTEVSSTELSSYPIGGNVTFRPGVRLVKITTDPKVYAVGPGATLHWVTTAALAEQLFGSDWASLVQDIPDAFFVNYEIGNDITTNADYNRSAYLAAHDTYDDVLRGPDSSTPTDNSSDDDTPASIEQSGFSVTEITATTAKITWNSTAPLKSVIHIGTSTAADDFNFSETGFAYVHIAELTDLQSSTTYYYRVTAVSENQENLTSEVYSFTTGTPFATTNVTPANWEVFDIDSPVNQVKQPSVAAGDNAFGIAWAGRSTSSDPYQVYFRRVNYAGSQSSNWINLFSDQSVKEIAMTSDGSGYFIAWIEETNSTTGETALYTATVGSDGAITRNPVQLLSEDFIVAPESLDVEYNGSSYAVVFSAQRSTGNNYQEVFLARVNAAGIMQQDLYQVTDRGENSTQPDLAWNGSSYGLVWRGVNNTEANIYFISLDDHGYRTLIPTETAVNSSNAQFPGQPSIIGQAVNEFAIAWYDYDSGSGYARQDVYWKTYHDTGKVIYDQFQLTEYDQAFDGIEPTIIWAGQRNNVFWFRDDTKLFVSTISGSNIFDRQRVELASGTSMEHLVSVADGSVIVTAWVSDLGIQYAIGE